MGSVFRVQGSAFRVQGRKRPHEDYGPIKQSLNHKSLCLDHLLVLVSSPGPLNGVLRQLGAGYELQASRRSSDPHSLHLNPSQERFRGSESGVQSQHLNKFVSRQGPRRVQGLIVWGVGRVPVKSRCLA